MKPNVTGKKIGKSIKDRRNELGWSQTQLAERINSDQGFISKLESGRNTTINVLGRVSDALSVDIADLMR